MLQKARPGVVGEAGRYIFFAGVGKKKIGSSFDGWNADPYLLQLCACFVLCRPSKVQQRHEVCHMVD